MKNRRDQIAKLILERLDYHGTFVVDAVLHADVNNRLAPHAALAEFDAAIKYLADDGYIAPLRKVGVTKWTLTEKGQAEVVG
jgi:hypothetical protein